MGQPGAWVKIGLHFEEGEVKNVGSGVVVFGNCADVLFAGDVLPFLDCNCRKVLIYSHILSMLDDDDLGAGDVHYADHFALIDGSDGGSGFGQQIDAVVLDLYGGHIGVRVGSEAAKFAAFGHRPWKAPLVAGEGVAELLFLWGHRDDRFAASIPSRFSCGSAFAFIALCLFRVGGGNLLLDGRLDSRIEFSLLLLLLLDLGGQFFFLRL